jgi:hypothetical protein
MDGQQFDALTRAFGRRNSRRAVLRSAAGGTVATVAVATALRSAAAGVVCEEGLTDCDGVCVDLATDLAHCGACGAVCESGLVAVNCIAGVCSQVSCPAAIPTYCGELGENDPNYVDSCVDTSSDPNNCGACGNVCASGECEAGVCLQAEGCEAGLTDCGGVCVDLATDLDNCGACGEVCESSLVGVACLAGECVRTSCPAALTHCGDDANLPVEEHCFDLATNPRHCGACFNDCGSRGCSAGVCTQDVDDDAHDDGDDDGGDDGGPVTLPNTGSGAAPAIGGPGAGWTSAALAAAAVFGAAAVRRVLPRRAADDL